MTDDEQRDLILASFPWEAFREMLRDHTRYDMRHRKLRRYKGLDKRRG